jgi:DNA-binding XRE family transcriptional regulator
MEFSKNANDTEILPTSGQLRAARSLLALTQAELAQLSGTSRRTIVTMEQDVGMVDPATILAVCSAIGRFGVTFVTEPGRIAIIQSNGG